MRSRFMLVIGVACLGSLIGGCSSKKDAPTQSNTPTYADVYTPGMVFTPTSLTVSVGTIVRFNIYGDVVEGHDVTFRNTPGAPQSIPVTKQATVERTFNTKGTFNYDCFTHPGMSGTVIVQ